MVNTNTGTVPKRPSRPCTQRVSASQAAHRESARTASVRGGAVQRRRHLQQRRDVRAPGIPRIPFLNRRTLFRKTRPVNGERPTLRGTTLPPRPEASTSDTPADLRPATERVFKQTTANQRLEHEGEKPGFTRQLCTPAHPFTPVAERQVGARKRQPPAALAPPPRPLAHLPGVRRRHLPRTRRPEPALRPPIKPPSSLAVLWASDLQGSSTQADPTPASATV